MQRFAMILSCVTVLALPAGADDRPIASPSQAQVPRLADIMSTTQLRHLKLWYAGKEKNWHLAEYELGQIKESFQDAMTYYPGLPASDMTAMAKPASDIGIAIRAKNDGMFVQAFQEITGACNACHRAQGYGYIAIKVPTSSPFSNQSFVPK